jgi:hypothetical protein
MLCFFVLPSLLSGIVCVLLVVFEACRSLMWIACFSLALLVAYPFSYHAHFGVPLGDAPSW